MSTYDQAPEDRPPLWERILFAIPLLGWIARDIKKDIANLYWAIGLFFSAWGIAIMTFGYPALIVVLLALVPIVFVLLILITCG